MARHPSTGRDKLPTKQIKRFADADTPLIGTEWYVVAEASELTGPPLHRRVLDRDLLLLRTREGKAVALSNRCPHRGYPLHLGVFDGDSIACGYHGIRFGLDGRCLAVPSQDPPPKGILLPTYPVVESGPWIWAWMGEGAPTPMRPAAAAMFEPARDLVAGHLAIAANYIMLHENLIDLSSFSHLLRDLVGAADYARSPIILRTDATTVTVEREVHKVKLPPFYEAVLGTTGVVDRRTLSTFHGPGLQTAQSTITLSGTRYQTTILHAITPERADRTHYFWAVIPPEGQPAAGNRQEIAGAVFDRIARALEEVARTLTGADAVMRQPVHLSTDQAGLEVRYILQTRAQREAERAGGA